MRENAVLAFFQQIYVFYKYALLLHKVTDGIQIYECTAGLSLPIKSNTPSQVTRCFRLSVKCFTHCPVYFSALIFMVRLIRFFATSTLKTCTSTISPTLTASSGCLIKRSVICEMCTNPS